MTEFKLIEKHIKRLPRLKPFFAETISTKYPVNIVRQVIKSLMKKDKVVSVARGMYVRPKPSRYLKKGEYLIRPRSYDVIRLIAKKTGEIIIPGYSVAAYNVGVSTQVPAHPAYLTSGRSRLIKIKNGEEVRLEHVSPKRIVMPGTITCMVVTALS